MSESITLSEKRRKFSYDKKENISLSSEKKENKRKKSNLSLEIEYQVIKETNQKLKDENDNYEKIIENLNIELINLKKSLSNNKDYKIPEISQEKDEYIIYLSNLNEYLKNENKKLKNDIKTKEVNLNNEKKNLEDSKNALIEQINILMQTKNSNEEKINDLNEEISSITLINKNLLIEIKTLNEIIEKLTEDKNFYISQNFYLKKEKDNNINQINNLKTSLSTLDLNYKESVKKLEELQNSINNSENNTFIFNVISVGNLIESNAEIMFQKNNFIIKYLTSSYKMDINDISNIISNEENIITIKYKENKKDDDIFKTNESKKIIKVFKELQFKYIQNNENNNKKHMKEEKYRDRMMKKNVKGMLNIFD